MMLCLFTATGLYMTSCDQEESKDLGDAPLFQRYMLAVGKNGETVAYAAFSKERNDFLKPVKMTGAENICQRQSDELQQIRQLSFCGIHLFA